MAGVELGTAVLGFAQNVCRSLISTFSGYSFFNIAALVWLSSYIDNLRQSILSITSFVAAFKFRALENIDILLQIGDALNSFNPGNRFFQTKGSPPLRMKSIL